MRNQGSAAEGAKCGKKPVSVRDGSCAFAIQIRQAKGTLLPAMVLNEVVLHNSCAAFEETFLSAVDAIGRLWAPGEMCLVADPPGASSFAADGVDEAKKISLLPTFHLSCILDIRICLLQRTGRSEIGHAAGWISAQTRLWHTERVAPSSSEQP